MSGDDDDIFDSEVGSTEGVSPEAPEATEPKAQPRDETGKFASKGETVEEPKEVPKAESAPPAPTKPDDDALAGRLAAMLDEREKRKRLEAERDELRRQLAARQPQEPLDPIEDPAGFQRAVVNQMESQFMGRFLAQSRFLAERDHGADFINEMMEFFDTQPRDVSAQFLQAPSPVHAAADWYKRHKAFSEIGDDPSAYRSRIEAEIRAKLLAEMSQQPQVGAAPSPSKVPKSLATASGTGRASPSAGGDPLFD